MNEFLIGLAINSWLQAVALIPKLKSFRDKMRPAAVKIVAYTRLAFELANDDAFEADVDATMEEKRAKDASAKPVKKKAKK